MLSEDRLLPPRKVVRLPTKEQEKISFQNLIRHLTARRERPPEKKYTCSDLTAKGANVKQILMKVCPERFRESVSPRIIKQYEPLNFPSPRIDRLEKQIGDKMREMRAKEAEEKEASEALKQI